jgi:hypothetical protein
MRVDIIVKWRDVQAVSVQIGRVRTVETVRVGVIGARRILPVASKLVFDGDFARFTRLHYNGGPIS